MDDDKEDLSRMLGRLCGTDWYRDYERAEMAGEDNNRKSPVYVEEQESSSEYIKGAHTCYACIIPSTITQLANTL